MTNNVREAVSISVPSKFSPRVNGETRQNNAVAVEMSKLKTKVNSLENENSELKKKLEDFQASLMENNRLVQALLEKNVEVETKLQEIDRLKALASRMMTGKSIGHAPGKMTRNSMKVSQTLDICNICNKC